MTHEVRADSPSAVSKAPEGHDEKMANLADNQDQPQTTTEEPRKYAGKYNSVEEMEKGYLELQKAFSSRGQQKTTESDVAPTEGEAEGTPENTEESQEDLQIKQQVEEAGLDFSKYNSEFAESGSLSDDSYKELEAKGFPKESVDVYIAGLQAKAETAVNTAYETAGGQEAFQQMAEWASQNFNEQEIQLFNQMVSSRDPAQIRTATESLKSRYVASNGKEANLLGGSSNTSAGGYRSSAEIVSAMSDPRYANDPAYRKEVEERLANSNVF